MASTSLQNMSSGSWSSLTRDERKKFILQVQEANNKMKLVIDERQKTLADIRQTVPEECREMFEKEKQLLLNHYTNSELVPHLPRKGMSADEAQRMVTNINERVEAQVADQEQTKLVNERTDKLREENENLRQTILKTAKAMLADIGETI